MRDHFDDLDAKLCEIESEAEAMRKDFDLFEIPEPESLTEMEPLFGPVARHRAVFTEARESAGEPAPIAGLAQAATPKRTNRGRQAETDRARMKLHLVQAAFVGDT
jgi:hypothetical protein